MWVEPDTNMPTGESLTRQILYGQRYFQQKFGVRHRVCWLPDCFGFSGGLPQLLKQGGIDSFFTIKVNWNDTNTIPADLFWWEGIDGSRVLTHTFNNPWHGYNGAVNPLSILKTWRNFMQKPQHQTSLLAVGYGDGGGGVTPEYVEREMQLRDFPVLPKARWSRVEDFFAAAHETGKKTELPIWQGDIYLELHRATLTTQSATKKAHRQAERALITAETLASLAALLGGEQPESLEHIWRVVLKNEFHDILPGSSIAEVYDDAERELNDAVGRALARQQMAMSAIVARIPDGDVADAVVVVNPSLSRRPVRVTTTDGAHYSSADVMPPLGIKVFTRADLEPLPGLSVSETRLENAHLCATIGADGTVSSLIHKATGREALSGRGNQLWVYPADKPRDWDAWDIEEDYAKTGIELNRPESIKVVEDTPARAAIRIVRRFRASTVTQTYSLDANGVRLDIATEIDWRDRHCLLRTQTPVAVRTTHATFEHANGVVQRTTHNNTSWDQAQFEVPGHRFLDMSEPGFGVALLNDAKYGHSAKGNVLGLSLVRSPVYPRSSGRRGRPALHLRALSACRRMAREPGARGGRGPEPADAGRRRQRRRLGAFRADRHRGDSGGAVGAEAGRGRQWPGAQGVRAVRPARRLCRSGAGGVEAERQPQHSRGADGARRGRGAQAIRGEELAGVAGVGALTDRDGPLPASPIKGR